MPAYLQHICAHVSQLRQGPSARKYGDPYEWTVTVVHLSPRKVELVGVDKEMTPTIWKEVTQCLADEGVSHMVIERIKGPEDKSLKMLPTRSRVKDNGLHKNSAEQHHPQREPDAVGGGQHESGQGECR